MSNNFEFSARRNMPVLPLRGLSVFPGMLLNFDVERPMSAAALNFAMNADQILFLAAQKEISKDVPFVDDIYRVGTVCRVRQLLRQPGSKTVRVMVEGLARGRIENVTMDTPSLFAEIEPMPDAQEKPTVKTEALCRRCTALFSEYAQISGNIAPESVINIMASTDAAYVADFIAQNIYLKPEEKQKLLEELRPSRRLAALCRMLTRELTLLSIERDLNESTQEQMNRNQREYYLREQMKIIQSELGEDDAPQELEEYREKIRALHLEEETEEKLLKEVTRLSRQSFGSAEGSVIRGYLDTCLEIPWNTRTKETLDIARAQKMLDEDHFGLEKVKERVIEFLSVRKLAPGVKGGVLCLVGPPGTGKTSIAMSIARATNRKLARVALGGVHDEAEIRGHRKTYIGAMPGRIIDAMTRAGSMNPLLVLDEIDKLASDMRGDPASALLEVFDSEQNYAFRDHFLEIPVDLSRVMFITTANMLGTIPRPLLDRMEVVELSSYTDEEKLQIAKQHLLPKQLKEHGLKRTQFHMTDGAIRRTITDYTRESGVRILERQIGKLCRKAAMQLVTDDVKRVNITEKNLPDYLGTVRYTPSVHITRDEVGVVNGLAWTEVGGEILEVEVNVMDGSGKLELTGNLGTVMQESAKAALSCLRSRTEALHLEKDFYKTKDIHIHFPEAATPKDGPSAGIAITTAMLSALTGRKVRGDIAMTGEVTLRGRVLPIGGLKEKTMAALRNGVKTVIIPKENEKDLSEIDQTVRKALHFIPVETVDAVFAAALVPETKEDAVEHMAAIVADTPYQEVRHGHQL